MGHISVARISVWGPSGRTQQPSLRQPRKRPQLVSSRFFGSIYSPEAPGEASVSLSHCPQGNKWREALPRGAAQAELP